MEPHAPHESAAAPGTAVLPGDPLQPPASELSRGGAREPATGPVRESPGRAGGHAGDRAPDATDGASARRGPADILFVEGSHGFGGSTVALGRLLAALDPAKVRAHVACVHPLQREHLIATGFPGRRISCLDVPSLRTDDASGDDAAAPHAGAPRPVGRAVTRPFRAARDWVRRVLPAAAAIARAAGGCSPELIHLNNSVCTNLPGIVAARRLGIPCVVKQRGLAWLSPDVRWHLKDVAALLASSRWIADPIVDAGLPADRVTVNWSPVQIGSYAPAPPAADIRREIGIPADAPVFGMVGCLHEWKGQHVFVESVPRVLHSLPGARAVLVGGPPEGGDTAYASGLRERAAALGVADRIHFLGHRLDVPRLLGAMDVVVHASVRPEPFGLAVVEAMAARRPVVAMAEGGPLEYVDSGENGLLVPPRDPESIAAAVVRVLRDPALAARLGAAARRTVEERFDAGVHARGTEEIYERLLAACTH